MKKVIVLVVFACCSMVNAQVFSGKGDQKLQVGANFQEYARGVNASYDYGLGENISVGVSSSYILGINDGVKADFKYKLDIKARFNANIGNVLNVSDMLDVYPGLHVGLKNFGAHLGARYFFTNGFGVYSEFNVPVAKYSTDIEGFEKLHNQFSVNVGAVFNL